MRASTIFALIAAVLLGLGAAVGIKYSGVLERRPETTKAPPPTLVLVAANNLYENSFLQATDVKIRAARSEEEKQSALRGELLPPVTQAAVRRVTKRSIVADSPIRRDDLEDLARPTTLADSIDPCNRGVHCCLHKQYCAGGLITIGDFVDVHLTTTVETSSDTINVSTTTGAAVPGRTQSAVVARGVRVISRRNSFVPVMAPLGPDCCINYTLSTNPYRAALIDYVKTMGILSLHPVGAVERARYEAESARKREDANALRVRDNGIRTAAGTTDRGDILPLTYCQTGDAEEDRRVAGILNGTYTISEKDLMELFGLKYVPVERPVPRTVEKFSGLDYAGYHELGAPRFIGSGDYAVASGRGMPARGGVRTVSGGGGDLVVDASGRQNVVRFRAPDAACPDRVVNAAPVVRRRN